MPELPNGAWLAAVMAAHGLVLGGLAFGFSKLPQPITPPAVVGMLILPAPPAVPPAPRAVAPKPQPKLRQAPRPRPRPPAPKPPPAPPSERAVTLPPQDPAPAPIEPDLLPVVDQEGVEAASDSFEVADLASLAAQAAAVGGATAAEGPPVTLPRTDASHLSNPVPRYPTLSRRFGEQGRVLLDVYILPDGQVGEIRLNTSSGFARLDEAALTTVRNWRFVPARRGDEPIPYWYVQPITFSLDR